MVQQLAIVLWLSAANLGFSGPSFKHDGGVLSEEDDQCSLLQLTEGVYRLQSSTVASSAQMGNQSMHIASEKVRSQGNASLHGAKLEVIAMSHQELQTTMEPNDKKALKFIKKHRIPYKDWAPWFGIKLRVARISVLAVTIWVVTVVAVTCCGYWVLSENAPPLFSQTHYEKPAPAPTQQYDWKQCLLAAGFAFVSGWADSICMMKYKAFATMMTGNFFQLGYTMIYPKKDGGTPDFYFITICTYFLASLLFRCSQVWFGNRVAAFVGPSFALVIILYEVFELLHFNPVGHHSRWVVPFLSPVFAVLNAVSAKGGLGMATGFLSGNFTDLAYALAERICKGRIDPKKQSMLAVKAVIIISCVTGAVGAALTDVFLHEVNQHSNTEVSLMPIAPLIAFAFVMHDRMFYKDELH